MKKIYVALCLGLLAVGVQAQEGQGFKAVKGEKQVAQVVERWGREISREVHWDSTQEFRIYDVEKFNEKAKLNEEHSGEKNQLVASVKKVVSYVNRNYRTTNRLMVCVSEENDIDAKVVVRDGPHACER